MYIGHRGLRRYFWNNTNADIGDLMGQVTPTTIENWLDAEGPRDLQMVWYDSAGAT